MASNDKLELPGVVTKILKGASFEVTLDDNSMVVVCKLGGKLRMNNIRVLLNDKVTVQISPYDLTKGIIVWRSK